MAVSTGTVGSGSKIKYVSYASGDSVKDIFDAIAGIMTGSGGWTLASGTSGSFYTTYYSSATTDFRRVYSSPLIAQGSGLTTKYVMLRIVLSTTASTYKIQLIPFGSWNSGTDVGTNQAGTPLVNNSQSTYGFDGDWIYNIFNIQYTAPGTGFANNTSGLIYVAFDPSAAYLMMWPYYVSGGAVYNGCRHQVLMYGEYAEDFASYTNVPPVYVTTLQRLTSFAGIIPTYGANGSYPSGSNYAGANNTNIGSLSGGPGISWYPGNGNFAWSQVHAGPLWLSPVAPGSTTGYSGVANTTRTGPQASAFQRMLLGHLGDHGFHSFYNYSGTNYPVSYNLINGTYPNVASYAGIGSGGKGWWNYSVYNYQLGNTNTFANQTSLNSTNLKGIEPILGGGIQGQVNNNDSAVGTAYFSNPYPLWWMGGRMRGLKYVGAPTTPSAWSTLDTVSMTVDSNGFFVKSGGTSTSFALVGFAPFPGAADASFDPQMFFAIPS